MGVVILLVLLEEQKGSLVGSCFTQLVGEEVEV